jgi:hypothetical protein
MAYANKKRPDGRFLLFSASGGRCVVFPLVWRHSRLMLRWFDGKAAA